MTTPPDKKCCVECGSVFTQKIGTRMTRKGKKQRYFCRNCGKTFY
jgi:transposase-like protein